MIKLKYEKYNNSESVISIDLHNGYTVIAIFGSETDNTYTTTLFLKGNTVDVWKLIENAENITFNATFKTINSAILKQVAAFLEEGFFDYYINRYEYEMNCFDVGNELTEKERLSGTNAS